MGLFDKFFSGQATTSESLNAAEAFASIALAAVASDGYLSEEEAQSIPFILSRMKLYENYSDDMMRRLFDKLLGTLQRDGVGALFAAANETLPSELRETAFVVAADLVLADGVVTDEEQAFLDQLFKALKISEETAAKVVDVMIIKNRG
jgi:tellurite resistance protein